MNFSPRVSKGIWYFEERNSNSIFIFDILFIDFYLYFLQSLMSHNLVNILHVQYMYLKIPLI